ncbi:MAG: aminoacetone oxidase family FAD-binding enzyme, partial [Candidatus Omnitrophica bacterium]|nr:aminoacetone oxidase family FAD-binding enzyme [Candidatus Omnitrophota bacterium]
LLIKNSKVIGVKTFDLKVYYADSVVLATGGLSYPDTGSTGDGYEMARKLGHRIVKPIPSLVGLVARESYVKDLQGLSLKNVSASLIVNGRLIKSLFGEMIFTHFGLSGPIILSLSREVAKFLDGGESDVVISLNLKPALNQETLNDKLLREIKNFGARTYKNLLKELLPRKIIPVFIMLSKIEPNKKSNKITQRERRVILELLTDFRFTIKTTQPIEEAIVTQGGVDTTQINPKTMESKLIKGLYIVGELLNVDGLTGGYNLQAAFSTGYVAGRSISLLS